MSKIYFETVIQGAMVPEEKIEMISLFCVCGEARKTNQEIWFNLNTSSD